MRLARLERVFERNPIYFVTACTEDRRGILTNTAVRETVCRFAEVGPTRGAWLGSFVLMPDHFHGFVALDGTTLELPGWMKSFKNSVSRTLRESGVAAPHWQKGFFDHVLRSSESYQQKWSYVRKNPVRAGLVTGWESWPFKGEPFPLEFRHEYL